MTIEPFRSADDLAAADLAALVEISNAMWDEWVPGEPPMSTDAFLDEERFTHAPEVVLRRLARDGDGLVVGFAQAEWRHGEPGTCAGRAAVAPSQRRRGIGGALLRDLLDGVRRAGRSGITIETPVGGVADGICERAGMHADMTVEQNRAQVAEPGDDLLEGWVAAGEAAEGYSLVAYDAPCPDHELAEAFIAARHVMNDAPRWEGESEASFTVEELRAAERAAAAAHMAWWSVGVRHDASGAVVGLSELYLADARRWIVFQGDTGVAPAHRGHGLGAWMKAVNHLRLRAERPEARVVQTWNASANEPMLRINRALGYRPVQTYRGWFLPVS